VLEQKNQKILLRGKQNDRKTWWKVAFINFMTFLRMYLQRVCTLELDTAVLLNEELERILKIEVCVLQF